MEMSNFVGPVFQQFKIMNFKKTLIVDRDDTLIRDQEHRVDLFKLFFLPTAIQHLAQISRLPVNIIVATNQGGVALGKFTEFELENFHIEMNKSLMNLGVTICGVISCLHHDKAIESAFRICECRKPKPGMLQKAMKLTDCENHQTAMIGDSWRDREASKAAKIDYFDANTQFGWSSALQWCS
jgi:D-glycero-D-manno-heptose 1,7-bisphosphate phosphatase